MCNPCGRGRAAFLAEMATMAALGLARASTLERRRRRRGLGWADVLGAVGSSWGPVGALRGGNRNRG
jgi:hypothetical protein